MYERTSNINLEIKTRVLTIPTLSHALKSSNIFIQDEKKIFTYMVHVDLKKTNYFKLDKTY